MNQAAQPLDFVSDTEYWIRVATSYETLFLEQKGISDGFRRIVEEQSRVIIEQLALIEDLKLNK